MVEQGGRGGVADYTACLTAALGRLGVPVVLATAQDHLYAPAPGVTIEPVFTYVRGHSPVTRMIRSMHGGWVLNGLGFLVSLPRVVRLARDRDVVHVQGWEQNILGVVATLALRATGARLVFTAHNTFERNGRALDGARVFGALSRATIVHTEADEAGVEGRVTRIPHGHYGSVADTAAPVEPEPARSSLGLDPDALVVLLFGVLRPDKGLGDLLEALELAPDWTALVAGEDHGALAPVADRLDSPELAGRVALHEGFAPMDQVGRFFAAADLVALPYQRASQSGALLLAYGFRRPVVAYPVGGLTEAVRDGQTGWLCAGCTPAALADALHDAARVGREEMRRRGAEGRAWSERTFGWDAIAAATERVYAQAASRGDVAPG